MADPAFYSNGNKVAETQTQYQKITSELEEQEAIWLEAMTA